MSSYEDYGKASSAYDTTRVAVGSEIVLGALAGGRVPLHLTHLLDAGCGTGSYAASVADHVASLALLDASEEMLALARVKLGGGPGLDYRVGQLQDLPFDDSSFDAVMTNQVLHHLGDEEGGAWAQHERAFHEYQRVLRPGGVLVVNTSSQRQLAQAYWYYALIPDAAERLRCRYAPVPVLEALAAAHDLRVTGSFVPVGAPIQGTAYLDGAGPLSASWRLGDSAWALVEPDELSAVIDQVSALIAGGEIDDFVSDHDAHRRSIGQITFLVARAGAASTRARG